MRLAIVATLGLGRILSDLADLRKRSADDIAAARARARAKAEEDAVRAQIREQARARREAREAEVRATQTDGAEGDKPESDTPEPETSEPGLEPEPRDRDPLVEALDKRLAAVDPAIVDFDDLKLRETVLRICADLGVTPDWSRWEAGDWATPAAPAAAPVPPPKPHGPAPRVPNTPVLPGLPGSAPRPADTTPVGQFLAELEAERRRRTLE